jgi:AcrR family transcriptional regulator
MGVDPDARQGMARPTVAEERREQILQGLFNAIAKRGFHACSITDVAREAALPRGALHYYFASKEDMLVELMRRLGRQHLARLRSFAERHEDPLERLVAVFRWHFEADDQRSREISRVWIEFWGYGVEAPGVQGVIQELQHSIRRFLEETVAAGMRQGCFRQVDAAEVGILMLGMLQGPMLQRTYQGELMPGPRLSALVREMLSSFLRPEAPAGPPA